jgi:hypothetical protein
LTESVYQHFLIPEQCHHHHPDNVPSHHHHRCREQGLRWSCYFGWNDEYFVGLDDVDDDSDEGRDEIEVWTDWMEDQEVDFLHLTMNHHGLEFL